MILKNFIVKLLFILIVILCLVYSATSFAIESSYIWSDSSNFEQSLKTNAPINGQNSNLNSESNSNPNTNSNTLNLESGSAILIEQSTGQILYEHNIHEKLRPASVTKIMSVLLVMEALDSGKITLEDKVPCSSNASSMGGSQIWLNETEELTVNEMLKAMCVVSANDCTVAMAEYIAGSQEAFVEKMNTKAKELRMNDTCFKNCHGIDEDGHITSSYDIAIMSRELLTKHPSITQYTSIWMDSLRDGKSELGNN